MRVALRTDASRRIGTGHLRRCQSVAQALQGEGAHALFVCRDHDDTSHLAGGDVLWLPRPPGHVRRPGEPAHADWAGCSWEQDAHETIAALQGRAVDWVLVDHYAFDARWHEQVAAALGCRIAAIDDLADRPLAARVVVDQNLSPDHAAKYAATVRAPAKILGGPRYAMLSPAYRTAPRYRFRRQAASIGIFMGGGDPDDFTSRALRACREVAKFTGPIEVVSSSRNPNFQRHLDLAARWPGTRVLHDEPDLSGFFARHDLQIGSGGIAAWERCCLHAPTLAVQIAPNQRAVLPELAAAGAVEWLDRDAPGEEDIGQAVHALLASPRRRLALVRGTRGLVDGLGAARVAAVLALAVDRHLQLRSAAEADERLLLHWANDPRVRANSFSPGRVTAAGHRVWFRERLSRAGCAIFVATSRSGVPVGQVRFESGGAEWVIDYSLDEAFRGWGLGARLLQAGMDAVRAADPGAVFKGIVKPGNDESAQVFRTLGFSEGRQLHKGIDCGVYLKRP